MNKLKILRIVPFFYPAFGYGGPVRHTYNISKIQTQMGYDVRVFTSNIFKHNITSKNLPKFEQISKIKIHRLPILFKIRGSHYFITPTLLPSALKYDCDLVHAHTFRSFQTDMATFLAKIKKKPFVLTAHGNMRDLTKMKILETKSSSKLIRIYDKFVKYYTMNAPDVIIVHSKYEKIWTEALGVKQEKLRVIPHGVNVQKFSDLNLKEKFVNKFDIYGKLIVYVGRILRGYRDLKSLIKIMPSIIQDVPDAKLLLIGESFDKEYKLELKKNVDSLNLRNNVHFILNPTWDDIVGSYLIANLFVFPTNRSESFGIPLLEAGAARCPVIAPNIGPVPELIKDKVSGLLYNFNDDEDMKDKILKLITDDKLEKKLGNNGFKNVSENFTWEKVTELTNRVYSELLP
jgi:glycosyltransferase involved in cell wall biosynthesis